MVYNQRGRAYMSDVGRPTIMTPETLQKLDQGFSMGFSDIEACLYAGIAPATLYNYQKDNPKYLERKEELKDNPKMIAKQTVFNRLGRDVDTAKWYLERKSKNEFAQRSELTGKDGKDLPTPLLAGVIDVPSNDSTKEAK